MFFSSKTFCGGSVSNNRHVFVSVTDLEIPGITVHAVPVILYHVLYLVLYCGVNILEICVFCSMLYHHYCTTYWYKTRKG